MVLSKAQLQRIPLAKPVFDEEMRETAIQAMQNEHFVMGESVFKFEEEFARFCATQFAVSTASGTAALTLSLVALGAKAGEVITSPASFIASANSILHAGATPTFADVTLQTYTIDPTRTRAAISNNTKAIMPVHIYGIPAAIEELSKIASKNKLALVEDACQAHGASRNGKLVGSIGDVGCFSFYPSKNMTVCGDGGMVVTNDEKIADKISSLRNGGRVKDRKGTHNLLGFTERLNTVQAAIGRVQLRRLKDWNEKRVKIASRYDEFLSEVDGIVLPPKGNAISNPVYHMYVIRCPRRDELNKWLGQSGIECGIHYQFPIHLQPLYRNLFGYVGGEFPNAELLCKEALSIPMFPTLTDDEIKYVSDRIHEFYNRKN
jgi:perosamine synthetase